MTNVIVICTARPLTVDCAESFLSGAQAFVSVVRNDEAARGSFDALVLLAGSKARAYEMATDFMATSATDWSCVLFDIKMPSPNLSDLSRRTLDDQPYTPILVLPSNNERGATVSGMKASAGEILSRLFADEVLTDAVHAALDRRRDVVAKRSQLSLRDRYESLTRREREVMSLIAIGRLNKQVGAELGISETTVKAHRGRVMEKMKANSFAELVKMSLELGPVVRPRVELAES